MSKRLIIALLSGALILGVPFLASANPQAQSSSPETQTPSAPAADMQTAMPSFGQYVRDIRLDFKDLKKELKEEWHAGILNEEEFKKRMDEEKEKMQEMMAKAKAEFRTMPPKIEAEWLVLPQEEKAALEAKYRALAEEHQNYGQEVREIRHNFNEMRQDFMERFFAGTLTEEEMRAAMREAREKMEEMLAKEKGEAKENREEMKSLGLPAITEQEFWALSPEEQAALEAKFREAVKERRGYFQEVREVRHDFNDMKKKIKEFFREGELTREEFKARVAAEKAKMEETIKNLKLDNQALRQEIRALKEQLNQR